MSTNQKIILLIILVGSVTAIGIYEIQPGASTSNTKEKAESDDSKSADTGSVAAGNTGDTLFSDSGDTTSDSSSGGSSGTTDGDTSSEEDLDIFGEEQASAENRVEDDDSGSSSDPTARIPERGDEQFPVGGDDETSDDTGQNSNNQSESSDTGNVLGNDGNETGNTGSSSDNNTSGSGTRTYKVQAGDKLWTIAEKFYGSGKKWKRIKQANQDRIPADNSLKRGWTLTIPELEQDNALARQNTSLDQNESESNPSETSTNTTNDGSASTYEVQSGDRLWNIIKQKYGRVTEKRVQKVAEINDIEPDSLRRGMTLTLPNGLFDGGSELESDRRTNRSNESGSSEGDPPFQAEANQEWYRVKKGESLWKVSKKKYGTGKHIWKIWELNKDRFEDYNSIPEGSWILVPKNP